MKLLLKDFQNEAVNDLVSFMRDAAADVSKRNRPQAVSLASPTGSGKTVIATAAIERILDGDGEYPAEPNAVFLWISDQPEINEQTRRKMQDAASALGPSRLHLIDPAFDQETLTPGRVYLLNTQKVGKDRTLVRTGDERGHTVWETITNTVQLTPDQIYFFVFVDEAHRGMGEDAKAREQAATIIQKFIKGSPGEVPAIPLVVGISATPSRFQQLVTGTSRTLRQVVVDAASVRASGLLKEIITLHHPSETQPSDITLLRAATRTWWSFAEHWKDYCEAQGEPLVEPILVVQVEDGTGRQISRTDLAQAINAITDEIGPLPDGAFAHSSQDGTTLRFGEHEVRHLAPPDIQDDADVRVVFFKTGLNTGWDCPRAEVMMSFRRAVDSTLIAQLIGRMVRTPLGRRIDSDEFLNTVALYLPHFDRDGLDRVISDLTAPGHEVVPPVDVELSEDVVPCLQNATLAECFEALRTIPSYVLPATTRASQLRRLMKFARLLEQDDLEPDASEAARNRLVAALKAEYERAKDREDFELGISEKAALDVRTVQLDYVTGEQSETASTIATSAENVDDLFEWDGRKLLEGLHKDYWRARVRMDGAPSSTAKIEAYYLASDPEVRYEIEKSARQQVLEWLGKHESAIERLPEGRKQRYDEVRRLAGEPETAIISAPDIIEVRAAQSDWERHLYVDEEDCFPCSLNTWETKVIEEALDDPTIVGWLRNPDRKPWPSAFPTKLLGPQKGSIPTSWSSGATAAI